MTILHIVLINRWYCVVITSILLLTLLLSLVITYLMQTGDVFIISSPLVQVKHVQLNIHMCKSLTIKLWYYIPCNLVRFEADIFLCALNIRSFAHLRITTVAQLHQSIQTLSLLPRTDWRRLSSVSRRSPRWVASSPRCTWWPPSCEPRRVQTWCCLHVRDGSGGGTLIHRWRSSSRTFW